MFVTERERDILACNRINARPEGDFRVAVGMAVTCHPPHRSVHAELPHTAPALGFDAEARYAIRMHW
jgi:hypothetical protein